VRESTPTRSASGPRPRLSESISSNCFLHVFLKKLGVFPITAARRTSDANDATRHQLREAHRHDPSVNFQGEEGNSTKRCMATATCQRMASLASLQHRVTRENSWEVIFRHKTKWVTRTPRHIHIHVGSTAFGWERREGCLIFLYFFFLFSHLKVNDIWS
jgi:hypothetical protein